MLFSLERDCYIYEKGSHTKLRRGSDTKLKIKMLFLCPTNCYIRDRDLKISRSFSSETDHLIHERLTHNTKKDKNNFILVKELINLKNEH